MTTPLPKKTKPFTELVVAIVGAFVGTIAGAIGGYYIFQPSVYAIFHCTPMEGEAPLQIKCDNESPYYSKAIWEIDEEKPIENKNTIEPKFSKPGDHKITLTVLGHDKDSKTKTIKVTNLRSLSAATTLKITATTSENKEIEEKRFQVNFMKDDHPVLFGSSGRDYSEIFIPDDGFHFTDVHFASSSANHASDPSVIIAPNGSSITISSRIESGPQMDRWRGWLSGVLIAKQERVIKYKQNIEVLPKLVLDRFGKYYLQQSIDLASLSSITIYDAITGVVLATGSPTSSLVSKDKDIVFSFENKDGQLVMEARKSN
jgi:PKD repeat protein